MMDINTIYRDHLREQEELHPDSVHRVCLHQNPSQMQIMLISLPPLYKYDFFRNRTCGNIVFVGIYGDILIKELVDDAEISYIITSGAIICISKTNYRSTINVANCRSLYLECIDGPYSQSDKEYLV